MQFVFGVIAEQLQVFNAIIKGVVVDVMYYFGINERASNMACHNKTVFRNIPLLLCHTRELSRAFDIAVRLLTSPLLERDPAAPRWVLFALDKTNAMGNAFKSLLDTCAECIALHLLGFELTHTPPRTYRRSTRLHLPRTTVKHCATDRAFSIWGSWVLVVNGKTGSIGKGGAFTFLTAIVKAVSLARIFKRAAASFTSFLHSIPYMVYCVRFVTMIPQERESINGI
jgi:hypothetical protein